MGRGPLTRQRTQSLPPGGPRPTVSSLGKESGAQGWLAGTTSLLQYGERAGGDQLKEGVSGSGRHPRPPLSEATRVGQACVLPS